MSVVSTVRKYDAEIENAIIEKRQYIFEAWKWISEIRKRILKLGNKLLKLEMQLLKLETNSKFSISQKKVILLKFPV